MRRKLLAMLWLLIIQFAVSTGEIGQCQTNSVFIPGTASAGRNQAPTGNGLRGFYYAHPNGDLLQFLSDADAWIAGNTPTAGFLSTRVDYPRPGYGSDTTGELLGPDAISLDPPSITATKSASVWHLTGYIGITPELDIDPLTPTIDVDFGISSDDAARLTIGGVQVVRAAQMHADPDAPSGFSERGVYDANDYTTTAMFETAGLYPVDIVWFDWYGGIQLHWYGSIPDPDGGVGAAALVGIVPTRVLYTQAVPEPGTLSLLGASLFCLAAFRRRRL